MHDTTYSMCRAFNSLQVLYMHCLLITRQNHCDCEDPTVKLLSVGRPERQASPREWRQCLALCVQSDTVFEPSPYLVDMVGHSLVTTVGTLATVDCMPI